LYDQGERTEIWNGTETIIRNTLTISPRSSVDCCFDHNGPSIVVTTEPVWKGLIESYNRGIKSRYITEITAENVPYCKELMKYIEVRHLDGIKGNFAIADRKELQIHEIFQKQKPPSQAIYTNVKGFVEAQQYVFESFWNKAIPVADKIKEIEQGIKLDVVETIKDPLEIQRQYINLVRSATHEIMLIIPTTNALMRHIDIGVFQLLRESTANNEKLSIRILTPFAESVEPDSNGLSFPSSPLFSPSQIQVRNIEQTPGLAPRSSLLIIDTKECLITEIKDDLKKTFSDAIGFATYSNSKATVLSYISIFESFWIQTEMYKKVKETEQMQRDFINIAAHELRNPIQPILTLTDVVKNKVTDTEQKELLDVVVRNAKKLKQLTEDVLDVTRIESQTLQLHKERFNLREMVQNTITDSTAGSKEEYKDNKIKLGLLSKEDTFIEADKGRIYRVISNLLSNAIKFTNEGTIITTVEKADDGYVIVRIKDSGSGIDSEILPRLFTKFATKSEAGGTGLGLFVSKNIVEAHGGRIWAENNTDGKGATFTFSVPVSKQQQQLPQPLLSE
jgi:two-component system, OmpR family, sensor histidine kinase VicK